MTMREIGAVFADADVARAYQHRAPFPAETFTILAELLVGPRALLDLGAGSGAVARHALGFADRVDAIDPSIAMIDVGRRLEHGDDPRIRWIVGTAEEAPLDPPYGLATAGASLHWMDLERVIPRIAAALAPGARLALLETEEEPVDRTWHDEAVDIARRYDESGHHQDLPEYLDDLERDGRFVREGLRRTAPVRMSQAIDEYLEWRHSTSSLARVRIGGERAAGYDAEMRALFARRGLVRVELDVVGLVVYGRPVAT